MREEIVVFFTRRNHEFTQIIRVKKKRIYCGYRGEEQVMDIAWNEGGCWKQKMYRRMGAFVFRDIGLEESARGGMKDSRTLLNTCMVIVKIKRNVK